MSSGRPRRRSIVERLVKILKPPKAPIPPPSPASPSNVFVAVKAQRAPAPRLFSLENRSEHNIAHNNRAFATANASVASLGRPAPRAKGAQPWYIPNETTLFPLPAPRHPVFRPQTGPATLSHGHVRQPSLSISASSHDTSYLHSPNSAAASRPHLALWMPNSGTINPDYEQKLPTGCRDGMYFDLADGEGPPAPGALGRGAAGCNEASDKETLGESHKKPTAFYSLELRSSIWIRNEVEGIEDEEMRRLATVAFL